MSKYFIDVIKNHYFDFSGRASRKQYWLFVLWCVIIGFVVSFVLSFISGFAIGAELPYAEDITKVTSILNLIFSVVFNFGILIPSLAIQARRLRDGGFSPWLLLLYLIPIIGWIILFVLYIWPSKK